MRFESAGRASGESNEERTKLLNNLKIKRKKNYCPIYYLHFYITYRMFEKSCDKFKVTFRSRLFSIILNLPIKLYIEKFLFDKGRRTTQVAIFPDRK